MIKQEKKIQEESVKSYLSSCFRENDWRWMFAACVTPDKSRKLELLHDIMYESDPSDLAELENKIYCFGSMLSEKDYLERELFVYMVTVLNSVKRASGC